MTGPGSSASRKGSAARAKRARRSLRGRGGGVSRVLAGGGKGVSSPAPASNGGGDGGGADGGDDGHGVQLGSSREPVVKPPRTAVSTTTASSVSASSSFVLATSAPHLLPFSVPGPPSTSSPRRDETEIGVSGRAFRESTADWLQEEAARQRGSRGGGKGRLSLRRRERRTTLLEGESEGKEEEEEEERMKEMGVEGAQKETGQETGERVVEDDEEEGGPFGRGRHRLTSGSARASTYARSSFSSRGGRFLASPGSSPRSNGGGSGIATSLDPVEDASAGEKEVVDWEATATPVALARRRAGAAEGEDGRLSANLVGMGVRRVALGGSLRSWGRVAFSARGAGSRSVYGSPGLGGSGRQSALAPPSHYRSQEYSATVGLVRACYGSCAKV